MEHPMFKRGQFEYDVGVVVIKEGMILDGSTVVPIEVVDPYDDARIGDMVTISGWGQVGSDPSDDFNSNLQEADFVVVENKQCVGPQGSSPIITDVHICIKNEDGTATACEGDQGVPVVDESGLLAGVVAMFPDCDLSKPLTVVRFSDPQIRSFIMTMTTE